MRHWNGFRQFLHGARAAAVVGGLSLIPMHAASATSLDDAATVLPQSINTFMAGGLSRSFDANAPDFLAAFAPFVSGDFLSFASFAGGLSLSGELAMEVAGFADLNQFGLLDANNNFTSLFAGADGAGADFSKVLAEGSYTFALNSPAGLFSSVASSNADGLLHLIGQHVVKDGEVKLNGLTFNLFAGDYVLYMEDLFGNVPGSDMDYNDSVVIIRAKNLPPVPEPATLLLLSSGLLGMGIKRRRA